jgi:hypothetical protein
VRYNKSMATTTKTKSWTIKHREGYTRRIAPITDECLQVALVNAGYCKVNRGSKWEKLGMPGPATDPRVEAFLDEMANYR